ncbi:MAG: hypothetical protein K9W43_10420 [Candidatus Thorarchaeota archaeon]|nr:hypothetical protein [Candidatus Thorarchaeota archaeon]
MVVRLVARVELESMDSKLIYPRDEAREERIALLTGILQLVSAALSRTGGSSTQGQPMFMKSDKGVIGYLTTDEILFICEGDGEREVGDALKTILKEPTASDEVLSSEVEKALKRRGREIGDLWR